MNVLKMDSKEAMASYCRAQANINKVARETDEARKLLGERIRTYRSLLQDELTTRNMTCAEMTPDGQSDPVFFRMKQANATPPIDLSMVMTILKETGGEGLHSYADDNGHDLPKMLAAMLHTEIKTRYTKKSGKMTLSITNAKERGYVRPQSTPTEIAQLAHDLYSTRTELAKLRDTDKQRKQVHVEEQRLVEEQVKTTLKDKDPVNHMTRVHMTQDGDEWVYYLRCKDQTKTTTFGARKIVPMVEDALVKTLQSQGLGREFTSQFCPTVQFWEEMADHLTSSMEGALRASKTTTTLTLDRGAPRKARALSGNGV